MRFLKSAEEPKQHRILPLLLALLLSLSILPGCSENTQTESAQSTESTSNAEVEQTASTYESAPEEAEPSSNTATVKESQIPDYTGSPYTVVENNNPNLGASDAKGVTEDYSSLDTLGRCGVVMAVVSPKTMPTEERGSIGMVKPSGWHTIRYDDLVDGKYLYNRCHLLGYQLTGENANRKNLVTGTRYMNVDGMLPFENQVADYVEQTGDSVLMKVTPVFVDDELVARGVQMEALSLDDDGKGVRFNVFCHNVQPGVSIDYETGESWRTNQPEPDTSDSQKMNYVLNTSSKKFHLPGCRSINLMADHNKQNFTGTKDELTSQGYDPCGNCNP